MSTSQELTQSLVEQINAGHSRVCALADVNRQGLIDQVNEARATGIYLKELKEKTPHGQWLLLFTDVANSKPVCNFSRETARIYMRIYEALPEPITELDAGVRCLKDVMIAVGALSAPAGHGGQERHALTLPSLLISLTGELESKWKKVGGDDALATMTDEGREQLREQIRPLRERVENIWKAVAA